MADQISACVIYEWPSRFLPGLNQNRFNNHQMMPQRPQRPPPPMNRPSQPEREPQSSHPTSGKEFHILSAFSTITYLDSQFLWKGGFMSEDTVFYIAKINNSNHYPEPKI